MPLYIDLNRDRHTRGYQLSIGDESGGYRIAGPKYSGDSQHIQRHTLTERDAEEIRRYLDVEFPVKAAKDTGA